MSDYDAKEETVAFISGNEVLGSKDYQDVLAFALRMRAVGIVAAAAICDEHAEHWAKRSHAKHTEAGHLAKLIRALFDTEVPVQLESLQLYVATVCLRRDGDNRIKPECETLDGRRFRFRASWRFDADERPQYAGEWAMVPVDHKMFPVAWIASGDLVDIKRVGRESGKRPMLTMLVGERRFVRSAWDTWETIIFPHPATPKALAKAGWEEEES